MARIDQSLSQDKLNEIESFLIDRLTALEDLRDSLDDDIEEEIKVYNNEDPRIDKKEDYEEKVKIPFIYTLVQTTVARVIKSLFPYKNYVKIYVEDPAIRDIRVEIETWVQEELDRIKFSSRARDFIEDGAVKRTAWLQLRPVNIQRNYSSGKKVDGYKIDFDILDWYNVWFDTKATNVNDTDFFIRKVKKLWEIKSRPDVYFNLDKVNALQSSDMVDDKEREEYSAKNSSTNDEDVSTDVDYSLNQQNYKTTDEVDIYEYYGIYDFSDTDINDEEWDTGIKEVICTLANKTTLIRVEVNDIDTKRKRLFFPIRPLRQSNSLIGKSFPQLTKSLQHQLNDIRSLTLDNFKNQIKLMFKYKKDGTINLTELYAGAGNAIGWEDNPNDIDVFNIPNLVGLALNMASQTQADMQSITGAVDSTIGVSGGAGSQTAKEVQVGLEQALFRFGMITENVYDDILEFINYMIILLIKYNENLILLRHPKLKPLLDIPSEDLEDSFAIDIALKDLSQRRDIEQTQWTNFIGVIVPLLSQAGGNTKLLLKELMEKLNIRNVDEILTPENPQDFINKLLADPALLQQVMQVVAQQQGEKAAATPTPGAAPTAAQIEGGAVG